MTKKNTGSNDTTLKNDGRTSPPGMAPDAAHAPKGVSIGRRETEVEEQFSNSPQNAQARQTERRK
ncbi:MAG TPA: hypothetical protein VN519_00195 [Bryobacteraceae bacterium]|nr:hypothetical protein [Bryobacteraceae bacterium]